MYRKRWDKIVEEPVNPLPWNGPWHGPFFPSSRFFREISSRSQKFFLFLRARPLLFPIWLFSIFEKVWILNLNFPFLIFPPIEISKTISKIWFSISNNIFEWKNPQNKALGQKWSVSRTISRQRIISPSRHRVKRPQVLIVAISRSRPHTRQSRFWWPRRPKG